MSCRNKAICRSLAVAHSRWAMPLSFTSLACLKGEKKIATAPFWSVKVKTLSSSVAKPNETVVYYLRNGPKRGFVREELLIVPPNTQLPPSYVM